ncbi:MAG: hypothetical protein LBJ17_07475 [Dysgonamonadaceae bacterium]|jgi:hypothetical protein|nr:hypothetical protein [Dysgonamonadaceae bacterium]
MKAKTSILAIFVDLLSRIINRAMISVIPLIYAGLDGMNSYYMYEYSTERCNSKSIQAKYSRWLGRFHPT